MYQKLRRPWLVKPILLLSCFQALAVQGAQDSPRSLQQRIQQLITGDNYRQATWSILVIDSKSGETLFDHNSEAMILPASVTKLFSVAAAILALGADFIFDTPVYARGKVSKGTLTGDLILVAQGDVTMGGRNDAKGAMAFKNNDHIYAGGPDAKAELTDTDPLTGLKALAAQIRKGGIERIKGEVLIDERLFDRIQSTGSGPREVSPIMVNDNVVDILIKPGGKVGDLAVVQMRPETDYVRMDAEVLTVAEGLPTRIEIQPGIGERFAVRGQIAVKAVPAVRIYSVEDPAGFARALFIQCLRHEGIKVDANPLSPPRVQLPGKEEYAGLDRVASFKSLPLSEVAKVTLKVSHNLYASTLPMLLAAKHGKRTLADGLKIQRETLAKLGLDVNTLSFGGGAGGAGADHVTAKSTIQLLQAMAARSDFPFYEAALPVLGVDGTLWDVVGENSPARGAVRAKTGTYFWYDSLNDRFLLTSKSMAGYMTTARGRRLTFAIFVNNVPLPRGVGPTREGRALGQLCEIVYQNAP